MMLYHGTTPEAAAAILASGRIEPGDSRGEGRELVWLTADVDYARSYGVAVVEVPIDRLPSTAIPSRIGPPCYAVPEEVLIR